MVLCERRCTSKWRWPWFPALLRLSEVPAPVPPRCATGISTSGRNPRRKRKTGRKAECISQRARSQRLCRVRQDALLSGCDASMMYAVQTYASLEMVLKFVRQKRWAHAASSLQRTCGRRPQDWGPMTRCASLARLAYEWLTALCEPDWMGVANCGKFRLL
jgi:hypothetical protein